MSSVQLYQKAKELRQERAKVVHESRAILDKAEAENRALNTEEEAASEKLDTAISEFRTRIDRLETQIGNENDLGDPLEPAAPTEPTEPDIRTMSPVQRAIHKRSQAPYQDAFYRYLQHGEGVLTEMHRALLHDVDLRAQTIGTNSEGGFATATESEQRVVVALEAEVAMRQLGTVLTIGSDRTIPVVDAPADGGDPALTAESAAYNEDGVVLEQRSLGAFKLTRLVRVSEELVVDDVTDFVASVLPSMIARRFGPAEEAWFVDGTGSGQPRGVLLDAPLGVTATSATAIAADEVWDLIYSVRRPYRARASMLLNDSTVKAVRKLKDTTNQYLWQQGMAAGEPDKLGGYPVMTSDDMPAIATAKKTMAFGDFSFYWIGDRAGRTIKRLDERYAELGQIGFVSSQRTDGVLTVQESVKHLVQA